VGFHIEKSGFHNIGFQNPIPAFTWILCGSSLMSQYVCGSVRFILHFINIKICVALYLEVT